jgi:hypothetical protein
MKKLLLIVLGALLVAQPSDAQFFKKLFKKKAKTEKKKKSDSKADDIDDEAQVAMADWATAVDNLNNRNAFLNIPLGIKADRFEKSLMEQNFTERKPEGKQTAKSYVYEGDVYGAKSIVTLATTDQTARVYAVDVEEEQIYPSLQAVQQRFQALKKQLVSVYGQGFVDNQGEAYTIQTRLGTISLHYERGSLTSSYTIGFTLDDAKAYCMAYDEMDAEDKEYENAPRGIESGLAQTCNHTDLVGLGVKLLQNRQLKAAQAVLRSYDYKIGKASAKSVPATFVMADYQATVSMVRKKQNIVSATITATDDMAAICKDLKTYGFTSSDQKTWRQGGMTVVVSTDKQGRVVVTLR